MDNQTTLTALDLLDQFFDRIREEARANPAFAGRLVTVLGANVVFEGEDRYDAFSPVMLAARKTDEEMTAIYKSADAKKLKSLLKEHNLATDTDMKGKKAPQLVSLLVQRARARYLQNTA